MWLWNTIKWAWRWFWDHFSGIITAVGWVVSFGIPAWAAYLSEKVAAYGPIAWVACGVVGLMAFALIGFMASLARKMYIDASIAKQFYQAGDRINPMKTHFLHERIKLEDLLPPGTGWVEGKTFEGCDLIGPLNIAAYQCHWQGNLFNSVDHILIDSAMVTNIRNARAFSDCRFIKCTFYNVSFLVGDIHYEHVTNLGGANWITISPKKDEPLNLPSSPLDEPKKS